MPDTALSDPYQLDKTRVRHAFNRAASRYSAEAVLQHQVRTEMLSRLEVMKLEPRCILEAGCGTGQGAHALAKRFSKAQVIALDIAPAMLLETRRHQPWLQKTWLRKSKQRTALVCADIEQLPLQDSRIDMVWSNLSLQWCNDLDSALSGFKRVLKPEGLLMFATFGPDTLKELRSAIEQDGHTHVSRFIDMHDIGDALVRAGFSNPVCDVQHYTLTYDDVLGLMRDLKAIGAHNATIGRARGLKGRGFLAQVAHNYEPYRKQGKLPATYEVVFAHAWADKKIPNLPAGVSPLQFVAKHYGT